MAEKVVEVIEQEALDKAKNYQKKMIKEGTKEAIEGGE